MTGDSAPAPDLYCYEAFAEEAERLRHYADASGVRIGLTPLTLQEAGHTTPPAPVISIRTQSILPPAWAPSLSGILSRSTGHDHLLAYRAALPPGAACPALGYLPRYCVRAVAEQALPAAQDAIDLETEHGGTVAHAFDTGVDGRGVAAAGEYG